MMFQGLKWQTQSQMFYSHQIGDLSLLSRGLTPQQLPIFLCVPLVFAWQPETGLKEGRKVNFVISSTFRRSGLCTTNLHFLSLCFFKMEEVEGRNFNSKERKLLCNNFFPSLRISSSKALACLETQIRGNISNSYRIQCGSHSFHMINEQLFVSIIKGKKRKENKNNGVTL